MDRKPEATPHCRLTVVFVRSKSASETGFAIRGREKNSLRREAVSIPLRHQHGEKGEGGRNAFFHFISLRIYLSAPLALQPQLARPALWGRKGGG